MYVYDIYRNVENCFRRYRNCSRSPERHVFTGNAHNKVGEGLCVTLRVACYVHKYIL